MRKHGIGKESKIPEEEFQAGAPAFAPSHHTSPSAEGSAGLTTAALVAPLPADTMSSAAALTISNPTIVNAIDTTALGIPDPSGLAFVPGGTPGTGALLLCDSEVNEPPFFGTNNLFHFSLSMTFDHATSLEAFTIEPTGVAYDPLSGHLFISDDDANKVFEVDATGEHADGWHDHVVDERFDDRAEGAADDDADGHVHDVAAEGELFEFADHAHGTFLLIG